jgi:hypothetical protein
MATQDVEGVHSLAPHHLPIFVPGADGSDPVLTGTAVFLVLLVLLIGIGYLTLHSLPEHLASETNRAQFQLVSILAVLALFTHNNLYWVAALTLAVVQIPDFVTPLKSIARSMSRMSRKMSDGGPTAAADEPTNRPADGDVGAVSDTPSVPEGAKS